MLIFLCWATIIAAADQQIIQSKANVKFTQNPELDIFEITIKGNSEDDYVITYRILTHSGKELYSYSTKYSKVELDIPEDMKQIQEEMNDRVKKRCDDKSGALPSWSEIKSGKTAVEYKVKVSKSDYNLLRSKNLPMCAHNVEYEGLKFIVYDSAKKKARVVAETYW